MDAILAALACAKCLAVSLIGRERMVPVSSPTLHRPHGAYVHLGGVLMVGKANQQWIWTYGGLVTCKSSAYKHATGDNLLVKAVAWSRSRHCIDAPMTCSLRSKIASKGKK